MEHHSDRPDYERQPVPGAEIRSLYESAAQLLIRRGRHKEPRGVYTTPDQPGALEFRLDIPLPAARGVFFPNDDRLRLDTTGCYLSYMTPHIGDPLDPDVPESNVYMHLSGELRGSDIRFNYGILFIYEHEGCDVYDAEITYEYSRNGRVLEEEAVQIGDDIVALDSWNRHIMRVDADRFRHLLDILERLY